MTKDEAVRLIEETFKNPFDEDRFRLFAKNLLNGLDESKEVAFDYYGQYILDAYKGHVKRYKRIGKYADPEGSQLDILIVNLEKETALDQARTMQRNFIASYLKKRGEKDAALVAFHTDGLEDWRFSFVRMDYRRVEEGGKVKLKEDLTPARRSSFLVGKNEPNHTARQQLLPIMQDDRRNPVLSEIESAFNIESVTNEFFEKYKGLFLKVEEELEGLVATDRKIKRDFALKKIAVADFAKKLLGQIVFLYFLQKKGWLGVEKDETGNFKGWGTGPKNFLRRLFDKKIVPYENFFNNLLEPLFYEALAIDRGVASFYSPFKCKIPFLNGGLFEPIGGYNWQETDILLKNDTFGEIFDTFDLFNFTVREDEPLEKEVAVDPEMLGKVFENLLEVKDRRSKGTFYTPREIVHYMCQESLINYLDAAVNIKQEGIIAQKPVQKKLLGEPDPEQLGFTAGTYYSVIPLKDIEFFIRLGVFCIENDIAKESGTTSYSYKLPESIRTNAGLLDNALSNIKICDPAIGSGAFPVGMLHEIVTARRVLTAYIGEFQERTRYDFKRHAIQESIYGVDIEVSAVDIAKLRLWLSLVVDEDDFETIKPLPNLDYKIVSGNSLFGVEKELLNDHLFKELERLKQQFFDETNPRKKKEEKEKIDKLISQLTHDDKHFDFKIYFSEVFHQKSGFDIVIANPPYLRIQEIQKTNPELINKLKEHYSSASGNFDIYVCFVELAVTLINKKGDIAYILPHKFFQAAFGKNLRQIISSKKLLRRIVDFGSSQVFESATTYTCLLFLSNQNESFKFAEFKPDTRANELGEIFDLINNNNVLQTKKIAVTIISNDIVTEKEWHFSAGNAGDILSKLRKQPRTLADVCEKIFVGLQTSADKIYFLEYISERKGVIAAFSKSLNKEVSIEQNFVKPLLKGADVHRYLKPEPKIRCIFPYKIKNGKAVLYTQDEIKTNFPLAWEYLIKNRKELENREHGKMTHEQFYAYIYPKNLAEFEKTKIVTPDIASGCQMTIDEKGLYHTTTLYGFVFKSTCKESIKYYLALLNSGLLWYFLTTTGSVLRGDFFRFKTNYLMPFPIPKELSSDEQKPFITLVDHILSLKQANPEADTLALETEIDKLVYSLYGMTDEEIKIVEGK